MKTLFNILLGLFLTITSVNAQTTCLTIFHDSLQQLEIDSAFKYSDKIFPEKVYRTLEMTLHVVQDDALKSDTLEYLDYVKLFSSMVDSLNDAFKPIELSFKLCKTEMIVRRSFLSILPDSLNDTNIVILHTNPGTINVFALLYDYDYIEKTQNSFDTIGYARMPLDSDYVFIDQAQEAPNLIHLMGHFFGLYHTHETEFGEEFVNGANCDTTGDLLCDTYADPDLSSAQLVDCELASRSLDSNGDVYVPSVANYMALSPPECRTYFTPQQYKRMVKMFWLFRSHLR